MIAQDVTVDARASLTIFAGVEVRFEGVWAFTANGTIRVQGDVGNPVTFRQNRTDAQTQFGIWGWGGGSVSLVHAVLDNGRILMSGTMRFVADGLDLRCSVPTCANAVTLQGVWDVAMRGVRIDYASTTTGSWGLFGLDTKRLLLDGFSIQGPDGGIAVHRCDACQITNGTLGRLSPSINAGLDLTGNDSAILNLNFPSGPRIQIQAYGDRNQIRGNHLQSAGDFAMLVGGNGIAIEGNVIEESGGEGISVYPTTSALIRYNQVSRVRLYGILLSSGSQPAYGSTVVGNSVNGSGWGFGSGQTQGIIRGNTFRANGVGAELGRGSNQVDHNHFEFNTVQARDTIGGNAWDDGYPSGGNWWTDYVGNDLYNGPLQNVPGPDGIGDTPYVISTFYQDRYPFYSQPAPGIPQELTAQFSRGTGTVAVTWQAAPMADAYYLYTANTPTTFDFSAPIRLGNVTSWTDGAGGARYYVVRGHNAALGRSSATSNTGAAWTKVFPAGLSTFSLPLAPFPWVDYAAPDWVDTAGEFVAATQASSLAYLEAGRWRSVLGDGDPNRTLTPGEGYLVAFPGATSVTFTGVPGAQIDYGEWPPYALRGFDPARSARMLTATEVGDSVVLEWPQLPEIPVGNGTYEVHASRTPAGLRGSPGVDYNLLATVPATGAATLAFTHVGALATSPAWYYLVVPVTMIYRRGASTYSVGVVAMSLDKGYSAIGLPLRPYANGTYVTARVSSLLGAGITGVQWFDPSRQDWVAHAAWMPAGTYDTPFVMIMAVQIDATTPTRIVFVGV